MEDEANPGPRLNSWKEIAAHLGVSVRTAQRWLKTERLPARRHRDGAQSSVFAYRSELETWLAGRPQLQGEAPQPKPAAASIAVLPFVNFNRDEESEVFSDGLTEELTNALAQVPSLHVAARTSAFYFKGKTGDVRAIGASLGVRTVLEGSVRRADDCLRITAQLISTEDGYHLWSQRYDRRMQDVFELQEEIARSIVEALRVNLSGVRIPQRYGQDFETYALYLEGRHYWNKRTPAGVFKAVECFERVLARDQGMAPAWAGLADCYLMGMLAGMPREDALRKGRAAARKALEVDDSLAEVHCSLAFAAAGYDHDWRGAETGFRRALELNPNHAQSHLLYGAVVLGPLGRLDEAEQHGLRACELDPLSAVMTSALGTCRLMMRRYDEAIAACTRALELDPAYPWAHRSIGEAHLLRGDYRKAEEFLSKVEASVLAAGYLGYCYSRTGREPEARQILGQLNRQGNPDLAAQAAVLHLGLGEREEALCQLSNAVERGAAPGVNWLRVEPIWDELRPLPEFGKLLRSLGVAD
jgi:adenylate cyclase